MQVRQALIALAIAVTGVFATTANAGVHPGTAAWIAGGEIECFTPLNSALSALTASAARGGHGNDVKGQADLAAPAAAVTATTVSVYFHVITSGSTGNVSDAQINQQLNVLSSAFAGSGFGFTLAGVTRTNNPSWFVMAPNSSAERNAKAALRQGDYGDLNIYSADPGSNLLGYATFPERRPRASTVQQDGIVVLHSSLPGGSAAPYDAGDTATHEAGHWFGLYHTFQGGCTKRGDLVDDTPAEAAPDYDCDESRDSCPGGGTDPVHNYMDYGDDACIDHFTAGQNARMSSIYASYRA